MKGFVLKKVQKVVSVMLIVLLIVCAMPIDVQAAEPGVRQEKLDNM